MGSANRAPYAIGDDGHPDTTTVCLRCPHCTVLAVPLGLTYSRASAGGISPDHPIEATCGVCAADHDMTTAAIVARDAHRTCARCRLTFAVPTAADEVVCPGCRLDQPGPATLADPRRAIVVDRIQTAYHAAVQARLRNLHEAADDDPADRRACARGGEQVYAGGDVGALVGDIDEVEEACVPDGVNRVSEHLLPGFVQVLPRPVVPFGAGGQVPGVGEGGSPGVVVRVRVPPGRDHPGRTDDPLRLGLNPAALTAVKAEGTQVLPGLGGPRLGR